MDQLTVFCSPIGDGSGNLAAAVELVAGDHNSRGLQPYFIQKIPPDRVTLNKKEVLNRAYSQATDYLPGLTDAEFAEQIAVNEQAALNFGQ